MSWTYDAVGARASEVSGGTTKTYTTPATSNRLSTIAQGTTTLRTLGYDAAGAIATDAKAGVTWTSTYDAEGRLVQVQSGTFTVGTYVYDAESKLAKRTVSNAAPAVTTHYLYDPDGHVIAETTPAGVTTREYVWLDDMPVAVIDAVNTASTVTYYVHTDHLTRPLKMTNAAGAVAWDAVWKPFGETFSITAAPKPDLGFPGQWTQSENALAWNWNRHYDPTTGRYTKPDPLRFVDGPSLYGYARQRPNVLVDPEGLNPVAGCLAGSALGPAGCGAGAAIGSLMTVGAYLALPAPPNRISLPSPNMCYPPSPCDPPEGTYCVGNVDQGGRPHGGLDTHLHVYQMQRNRRTNTCFWAYTGKATGPNTYASCSSFKNFTLDRPRVDACKTRRVSMRDHILLGYDLRDRYISIRGQPHSSGKMYYQASKDTEIWPRIIGAPKVENEFGLLCYETAIASSRERVLIMAKAKRCDVSFLSDSEARVYGPKNSMNNPTWDFIGYDVVDKCYYYSALFNFGLDGNAVETKAIKDVNKYGLIDSYDSADEFARYFSSNRNAINHTPFCPIALFVEGDA